MSRQPDKDVARNIVLSCRVDETLHDRVTNCAKEQRITVAEFTYRAVEDTVKSCEGCEE